MSKFRDGDRVQFTAETRRWNPGARSITGMVVKSEPNRNGQIRVRRDDLKTAEYWNEEAWEPLCERFREFLDRKRG